MGVLKPVVEVSYQHNGQGKYSKDVMWKMYIHVTRIYNVHRNTRIENLNGKPKNERMFK